MKINKKAPFLGFVLLAFVALSSCDKVKDAIQADIDVPNEVNFTIPQVTSLEKGEIVGIENISGIDLSKYSGLKGVHVKSLKVELLEEDPASNFKALKEISVEINSGSNTKVLATKTNTDFTTNQYSLEIPVTGGDIDIQNFVKNTFSYKITGQANTTTAKAIPAKLSAVYIVKFGL